MWGLASNRSLEVNLFLAKKSSFRLSYVASLITKKKKVVNSFKINQDLKNCGEAVSSAARPHSCSSEALLAGQGSDFMLAQKVLMLQSMLSSPPPCEAREPALVFRHLHC